VANAENTQSVDVDRLFIKQAKWTKPVCGSALLPALKDGPPRWRKRLSHVTIVLDEAQERS